MAIRKRYYTKTIYRSCPKWDRWFTKLERRCFGWFYEGITTEASDEYKVEINWDTGRGSARRIFYEWITFKRITPYTDNFLFKLFEKLMSLVSWLRRTIVGLIAPFLFPVFLIGGVLFGGGMGTDMRETILIPVLSGMIGVIFGLYVVSAIVALIGLALKKIFFIEERLARSLRDNGYAD